MLRKFEDRKATVNCFHCGRDFVYEVPPNYTPKFLEEFGEYQNLSAKCPHCAEEGRDSISVINMNLPESEFDEVEIEPEMPFEEINARKYVRDIMWKVRPDLRKEDRQVLNEERKQEFKEELENAREKIGEFLGGIGDKIDEAKEPKGDDAGKNIKEKIEDLLGRGKR